ncbi:ATP-binding protein [Thomasclavelia cocleata]|jgi:DNA replication protein DnaC|uniref:ATP-binding protein n=1 Tax=Thomasclavelia cocleata TaxID=69824 RepID=UPI00242AF460|nr:ATP-binding protein [Thomasclavelia cocleata]
MKRIEIENLPYKKLSLGICTKCNTEKFHCINDDGSIDFITLCDCEVAKENKERSNRLTDLIYGRNKIEYNKALCGLKKRDIEEINTIKYITNKDNIEAYNELIKYGDNFSDKTSRGYYICGTTGTGKSLLVKRLATKVLNKSYSVLFITSADLIANIKKRINEPEIRDLKRYAECVDLLIVDDLGVERGTEWEIGELFDIFNHRWTMSKPIVFTSNLSLNEIKKKYDKHGRIYSRILGGSNKVFTINGADKRIEQFKARNK